MTTNEINAWARIANLNAECSGKKVLIKRDDGKYLTRSRLDGNIEWTENKSLAYIYDYNEDRVGDQLQEVERRYNAKWTAEIYA